MLLEPEDLHALTCEVMAGAAKESMAGEESMAGAATESGDHGSRGVGVVAALEGGYDPARTGLGAAAVLRALAGIDLPTLTTRS
jgi:hypothetical protein